MSMQEYLESWQEEEDLLDSSYQYYALAISFVVIIDCMIC